VMVGSEENTVLRLSVVEKDCASFEILLVACCSLSSCICNFTNL